MVVVTNADKRLREILQSGGTLSTLCAETADAVFSGEEPDLIFMTQRQPVHIGCENAILIFHNGSRLPQSICCKNKIVIADSADQAILTEISHRRLPAITCGLCGSDTFTFSSLTGESAVISLQREITAFDGTIIEPFELPVTFCCSVKPFFLLAAAAIFSLMGKRNPLAGMVTWQIPPHTPQD